MCKWLIHFQAYSCSPLTFSIPAKILQHECFNIFFCKNSLYLVSEKINRRHLLPAVCISHAGKLYVWTEPCFKDACYHIFPSSLLFTPSSVAHWELWSFVSRHFCILLLLQLEFFRMGLLISRSEIKWNLELIKQIFFQNSN